MRKFVLTYYWSILDEFDRVKLLKLKKEEPPSPANPKPEAKQVRFLNEKQKICSKIEQ